MILTALCNRRNLFRWCCHLCSSLDFSDVLLFLCEAHINLCVFLLLLLYSISAFLSLFNAFSFVCLFFFSVCLFRLHSFSYAAFATATTAAAVTVEYFFLSFFFAYVLLQRVNQTVCMYNDTQCLFLFPLYYWLSYSIALFRSLALHEWMNECISICLGLCACVRLEWQVFCVVLGMFHRMSRSQAASLERSVKWMEPFILHTVLDWKYR